MLSINSGPSNVSAVDRTQDVNPYEKAAVDRGVACLERGQYDVAATHFRVAAELGNVDAMFWLGGQGERDENYQDALDWYKRAAASGKSSALFRVAMVYEKSGDIGASVSWYEQAAEAGERDAMFNLGNYYKETGDSELAVSWYARAAALGDDDAMRLIGALRFREDSVESALPWFEQAAAAGNRPAVGTRDAIRGAMTGDVDSVVFLAWSLEGGGNLDEARRWRNRAMQLGVADLEHRFGEAFDAVGDREQAIEWYGKSTLKGNRESLDGVMRLSTTKQFLEWVIEAIERGDPVANDFMTEFRENNPLD